MTRRGDLKLPHGATAKVRENAVKQDRVRVTNAIGHHPERSGFLRRTEFIGGTGDDDTGSLIEISDQVKQQGAAGLTEGQIAEFIEDDQVGLYQNVREAVCLPETQPEHQ